MSGLSWKNPPAYRRGHRIYFQRVQPWKSSAKQQSILFAGTDRQDLLWAGRALRKTCLWGITVTAKSFQYSFGPVPSRRLGKSLGINNIPSKVCTYSCLYCQVGRTTVMTFDRHAFYQPEEIFRDVQDRIAMTKEMSEPIDYLAFVPDGEPTLDISLGNELTMMKSLGIPIGVITNGSLLWCDDVREALAGADWVSLKIDAVEERIWRRIDRPHKVLKLSSILAGMEEFADTFAGKLVTETMLVKDINESEPCIAGIVEFIRSLKPYVAYLSIPTRPPALQRVRAPDEETVNRAYRIFADQLEQVEYLIGYEGDAFAFTGDIQKDLLSITAVHPMRQEAVDALLVKAGASWDVVDHLLAHGELAEVRHDGHVFYLRKFTKNRTFRTT
jgi:wyosine [tRNA(Phe)-imidazoG37] synthetase (radical SAM superfamily)